MNKTYLCTRIEYAPLWKVASISGTTVTFTDGSFGFTALDDVRDARFTEKVQFDKSGISNTQQLVIKKVSTKTEAAILNKSGIFRLRLDDGTVFIFGSPSLPVKFVSSDSDTNEYTFNYSRRTTQPEL